jgi:electron transfer flavoprotein alpha subunit
VTDSTESIHPRRIAVLVKQVPVPEDMQFENGRLVRDNVSLEVSAYCRRANAKALELAGANGEVVVFTMGPSSADDALREMIACGATCGIHLFDPAFAGSDTLATARVLAAAIRAEGSFDLVLCGLNSVDADTGQVGPEVAELLGLPFAAAVRELELISDRFHACLETDDGYRHIEGPLPVVLSCAERLIGPSEAEPDVRLTVETTRIRQVGAADLGLDESVVGSLGSPTSVGPTRVEIPRRRREIVSSVSEVVERLRSLGAFDVTQRESSTEMVTPGVAGARQIWCFLEPARARSGASLLGEAARIAALVDGSVTVVTPDPPPPGLGVLGADHVLAIPAASEPEQWAEALSSVASARQPWALLVEATHLGRAVASSVAARNGWGLTGDAIGFEITDDRLSAWKPAFGGTLIALIHSSSSVQMATVRPGAFATLQPRLASDPQIELLPRPSAARLTTLSTEQVDADAVGIFAAERVVGVGVGVSPDDYHVVERLCSTLGAELVATRKVTDVGSLPRARQVGLTGHSISPHLYVALGLSGKYNHTIGVRHAQIVLAVNSDPNAAVFDHADVGLVADWKDTAEELVKILDNDFFAGNSELVQRWPVPAPG